MYLFLYGRKSMHLEKPKIMRKLRNVEKSTYLQAQVGGAREIRNALGFVKRSK